MAPARAAVSKDQTGATADPAAKIPTSTTQPKGAPPEPVYVAYAYSPPDDPA